MAKPIPEIIKHKVGLTDTTLRDAHQSLWATRMKTEDMLPIIKKIDDLGYSSLEVWGGATFDVCLRYLNEDPWERLRLLKANAPKTPLMMLLRGQSLVGYTHYPDDVVRAFVKHMIENGIDIVRIFDALNDVRNIQVPLEAAKDAGAHVQASVVYTISPVHTTEHFLETAIELEKMGADSICIKDMAGLLDPYRAYELVKLFKKNLKVPVQLHSHYVGGMAVVTYLKAAEAGVDVVDTASVPLAFGSSQPPVETVVRALQGSPYDTEMNMHDLFEVAAYFEELRKSRGYERGVTRISDMRVFEHQVPGGMISNLVSQLEEQNALDRLEDVLSEIPNVRADMGYPPLVTPTSQMVGIQSVLNILSGERYKLIPEEVRRYVLGYYGKPPAPISEELKKKIITPDKKVITCRPADLLENKLEKMRDEIKDYYRSEDDLLSYALFPQVAKRYFEYREQNEGDAIVTPPPVSNEKPKNKGKASSAAVSGKPKLASRPINKEVDSMELHELKDLIMLINDTEISELSLESGDVKVKIKKGGADAADNAAEKPAAKPVKTEAPAPAAEPEPEEPAADLTAVTAPMVGTFYSAASPDADPYVQVGDMVNQGQTMCILEAMKLFNEIPAPADGRVVKILVENAQSVEYGQELFLIEEI